MTKFFILFSVVIFNSCGQTLNKQDFKIGDYYRVENLDFSIQLPHSPRITKDDSQGFKSVKYDYALETLSDDNFFYGIQAIYQDTINHQTALKDSTALLDIFDKSVQSTYKSVFKATTLSRELIKFKGKQAIRYEFKVFNPAANFDMIVNYLIFVHKNVVVEMYVYTLPEKQDNKLIDCFFDTVLLH